MSCSHLKLYYTKQIQNNYNFNCTEIKFDWFSKMFVFQIWMPFLFLQYFVRINHNFGYVLSTFLPGSLVVMCKLNSLIARKSCKWSSQAKCCDQSWKAVLRRALLYIFLKITREKSSRNYFFNRLKLNYNHAVTYQKFKYNFTYFKDCHVISAICYTVHSKDSLFNSLKIAVIKHRVVLKGYHMRLNNVRLQNFL